MCEQYVGGVTPPRNHTSQTPFPLHQPTAPAALHTGGVTETHQYSVTEYTQPLQPNYAPAVDVHYDLSPIVMTINERPPSLLHFIVRLCAVIGGAFAITRERAAGARGRGCHGRGGELP